MPNSVPDYRIILRARYPLCEWSVGDDYESLVWLSDTPKPSKKSLDDAWAEVQAEIATQQANKVAAAASGRTKLAALGLTDDEINALLGA